MDHRPAFSFGVSLEMYFGYAEALRWFDRGAELAAGHAARCSEVAELLAAHTTRRLNVGGGCMIGLGTYAFFWQWSDRSPQPLTLPQMLERTAELGVGMFLICDYPPIEWYPDGRSESSPRRRERSASEWSSAPRESCPRTCADTSPLRTCSA